MKMSDHIYDDYYNRLELAHDFTIELRREFSDLLAKYEALVKVCDKLDTEEQRTAVTQIMREEFLTGLMQRTVESANAFAAIATTLRIARAKMSEPITSQELVERV